MVRWPYQTKKWSLWRIICSGHRLARCFEIYLASPILTCICKIYIIRHEGVYVGPSAALNVAGAVKLALHKDNKGSNKTIVTILCDGGDRYASKMYDRDWLRKHALLDASYKVADLNFLNV